MVGQINNIIQSEVEIQDGEIVVFLVGKKLNQLPFYLNVGKVLDAKDRKVQCLKTGKIWKLYTSQIYKLGTKINSVQVKLQINDGGHI